MISNDSDNQEVLDLRDKFRLKEVSKIKSSLMVLLQKIKIGSTFQASDAVDVAKNARIIGGALDELKIFEFTKNLIGCEWSEEIAIKLASTIAGNIYGLRRGHSLVTFNELDGEMWCPVQVEEVESKFILNRWAVEVHYKVIGGPPTNLTSTAVWSRGKCAFIAKKYCGISTSSRRPKSVVFEDPQQLVNTFLFFKLSASKYDIKPIVLEIHASSEMVGRNRQLSRHRSRITSNCPLSYDFNCYQNIVTKRPPCPHGYRGENSCQLAVHKWTWFDGLCSVCGKDSQFESRPSDNAIVCLRCRKQRTASESILGVAK
jgi:hypothetical protein